MAGLYSGLDYVIGQDVTGGVAVHSIDIDDKNRQRLPRQPIIPMHTVVDGENVKISSFLVIHCSDGSKDLCVAAEQFAALIRTVGASVPNPTVQQIWEIIRVVVFDTYVLLGFDASRPGVVYNIKLQLRGCEITAHPLTERLYVRQCEILTKDEMLAQMRLRCVLAMQAIDHAFQTDLDQVENLTKLY